MDQIQRMINKTTVERLNAMEASKTCDEKSVEFAELDRRLQALAVLMLHYCAALQVLSQFIACRYSDRYDNVACARKFFYHVQAVS